MKSAAAIAAWAEVRALALRVNDYACHAPHGPLEGPCMAPAEHLRRDPRQLSGFASYCRAHWNARKAKDAPDKQAGFRW